MKKGNTFNLKNISKNLNFLILGILILLVTGCSNIQERTSDSTIEKNMEELTVNEDEIMTTLTDITGETKVYGTDSEEKISQYFNEKLSSYGYNVEFQDFEVYEQKRHLLFNDSIDDFFNLNPLNSDIKGTGRNIIVKSPNYDKSKKDFYIMAHYDTTKNTVGVYDNSTGVSAVIEIARVLKDYKHDDFNLSFILFSAEEYFSSGSRHFVGQLSNDERENILGAINIDMVGYTGFEHSDFPQVGYPTIQLCTWVKKDALENLFNDQFNNEYKVEDKGGVSDDLAFARIGIPVLYFTDENSPTGFEIEKEDVETQLEPVNPTIIAELDKDIIEFIKSFNINKFNELNSISSEEKGVFKAQ